MRSLARPAKLRCLLVASWRGPWDRLVELSLPRLQTPPYLRAHQAGGRLHQPQPLAARSFPQEGSQRRAQVRRRDPRITTRCTLAHASSEEEAVAIRGSYITLMHWLHRAFGRLYTLAALRTVSICAGNSSAGAGTFRDTGLNHPAARVRMEVRVSVPAHSQSRDSASPSGRVPVRGKVFMWTCHTARTAASRFARNRSWDAGMLYADCA
jgi:hypothetical protein